LRNVPGVPLFLCLYWMRTGEAGLTRSEAGACRQPPQG